jgi:hypothetical protein
MIKYFFFSLISVCFLSIALPSLSAQVPVRPNYNNPISMGLGSFGVGWKDPISSLYNNPGFLNLDSLSIADLGVQGGKMGDQESALQLGGLGGNYTYSKELAFWGIYNQRTSNHFPGNQKSYLNQGNLGLSYQFFEHFSISAGLGLGGLQRAQSFSPWSLSGFASIAFSKGNWSIGSSLQYLGKYRREDYQEVEKLEETLPEIASAGISYHFDSDWSIYSELRKAFWENAQVITSNEDVTPDYERGIGAEWSGSYAIQKKNFVWENFDLRLGNEWGGIYSQDGRLKRSLGLSLGTSYHWILSNEAEGSYLGSEKVSFHFGLLDYALTARANSREKETLASFSVSYQWKNEPAF